MRFVIGLCVGLGIASSAFADPVRVKAEGAKSFSDVTLVAGLDWTAVRAATEPMSIGTVTVDERTIEVLAWGAPLTIQGKDADGIVVQMKSKLARACSCGPESAAPCASLGETASDCIAEKAPAAPSGGW